MFLEGMIIAYAGPLDNVHCRERLRRQGWLVCDGVAVERGLFPRLFAAIGVTYGVGDGSTTFQLPDLRGLFVRGLDGSGEVDPGRALGQRQDDALKSHTHPFGNNNANSAGTMHAVWFATNTPDPTFNRFDTGPNGEGRETRPKNLAMHYLIRADGCC